MKDGPIVLESRFKDAFQDPVPYLAVEPLFQKEKYLVSYNASKGKVYPCLKDQAKSDDILKAAFHAHVLLHFIRSSNASKHSPDKHLYLKSIPTTNDIEARLAESCKMVSASWNFQE